ncbi:peptidase [Sphingomonas prati]|nr:peptidase [Sphingomonas prati]
MLAAAAVSMAAVAVAAPAGGPPAGAALVVDGTAEQGGVIRGTVPDGTATLRIDGTDVPFAADGSFILGFGRDAGPQARLVATRADGSESVRLLTVASRRWSVQSLPTLSRSTPPTEVFRVRREGELAQIAAARARRVPGDGWRGRFDWPVTGRISGVFGSQRIYAGEPGAVHAGVDIARPTGTVVRAPADGMVVLAAASPFTLEGRLLIVDHGAGMNSAFLHLSRIDVVDGQRVRRGQLLGAIGTTGRSTGPHLHWAVMVRDQRVDPARLAGPMSVEPPAKLPG